VIDYVEFEAPEGANIEAIGVKSIENI